MGQQQHPTPQAWGSHFFCAGQRFQLACLPANVTQGFFACLHTRVATRAGCSQVLPDSSLLDKSAGYIICEFLDLHISTLAHHQICEPWASEQWGIFKKNLKCSTWYCFIKDNGLILLPALQHQKFLHYLQVDNTRMFTITFSFACNIWEPHYKCTN